MRERTVDFTTCQTDEASTEEEVNGVLYSHKMRRLNRQKRRFKLKRKEAAVLFIARCCKQDKEGSVLNKDALER